MQANLDMGQQLFKMVSIKIPDAYRTKLRSSWKRTVCHVVWLPKIPPIPAWPGNYCTFWPQTIREYHQESSSHSLTKAAMLAHSAPEVRPKDCAHTRKGNPCCWYAIPQIPPTLTGGQHNMILIFMYIWSPTIHQSATRKWNNCNWSHRQIPKSSTWCLVINLSWPEVRNDCPTNIPEFWNFHDELSDIDGILKGLLLVECLTSQQHANVSQGRICLDNFMCCHTEIEAADQTFRLTQSQYTDIGPTSPSADPKTPSVWQGNHWSANFKVTGMTRSPKTHGASGIRNRDLLLSRRTP